jgi:ankyrin repeat protein
MISNSCISNDSFFKDDVSALHIACFENFEEIALLLVSYGADIHAEAGDVCHYHIIRHSQILLTT